MKLEELLAARVGRRSLLDAGRYGVGAAALGAIAAAVPGEVAAAGGPTEKWPWPYVKLDPARTADLAYAEWYRLFCGGAIVSAVFSQLREKVGEPYTSFPVEAFQFLEGGISGWGTICGANAGVNIVANVILGPKVAGS